MVQPRLKIVLKNLDLVLAAISLVLLIFITFAGVIMRYVLSKPFAWEEEVQVALIVWVVFLGGRYAFVTGNHPAIDMIVNVFPKKIRTIVTLLFTAFSVCVLWYVGLMGARYVLQMYNNHRVTNMLHIPFALIYSVLPIGCVLMSGQLIRNTIQNMKKEDK